MEWNAAPTCQQQYEWSGLEAEELWQHQQQTDGTRMSCVEL